MAEVPNSQPAEDSVKVGVLLAQQPVPLGEWLADAAAFDAGGADALWIDSGPDPELDVLVLTAALAVVTHRARLVVALPDSGATSRTVDTIGRLSHGRLVLISDQCEMRRVTGEPGTFEGPGERWESVPVPDGRQAWRAIRTDAAERGVQGLVVPADSRLLDLLRNPHDPDDRSDLQLAQG